MHNNIYSRISRRLALLCMVLILGLGGLDLVHAQGMLDPGSHGLWPVDLDLRTVTGTVVLDGSSPHEMYFLDEDGDNQMDFQLALGPPWYQPNSGAARPEPGATVTILGSVYDASPLPMLIVFELDGLSWRDQNEYGMQGWNGLPFWLPSADTVTATGTVLVDTTYFYKHFYLDTDADSIPEYQLVFGPDWYEPPSGALRPADGATIAVKGTLHDTHGLAKLVVYELDGLVWRQPQGPGTWAGRWMRREHPDTTLAYCVNDSTSWIAFPPGNTTHGMGGMVWPDSMFVQFWRIPVDSLPGDGHQGHLAGYFVDINDPAGVSMMDQSFGRHRGMMSFGREHQIRFDFNHDEQEHGGHSAEEIHVLGWDDEMHEWMALEHAIVDEQAKSVMITGSDLSRYYVLAASDVSVGIDDSNPSGLPSTMVLHQNYPNPFNPSTTIAFELSEPGLVVLSVYDLLGRKVTTLVEEVLSSGRHQAVFHAANIPSGIYVYRIDSGGKTFSRRMILLE